MRQRRDIFKVLLGRQISHLPRTTYQRTAFHLISSRSNIPHYSCHSTLYQSTPYKKSLLGKSANQTVMYRGFERKSQRIRFTKLDFSEHYLHYRLFPSIRNVGRLLKTLAALTDCSIWEYVVRTRKKQFTTIFLFYFIRQGLITVNMKWSMSVMVVLWHCYYPRQTFPQKKDHSL